MNSSLIHFCRCNSKHVALHSEIFWLLLWVFRENLWWTACLFRIFLIDSFGVFVKICGEHIDCRIKEAKLVLPAWFRNFSDCFLPIWRAFVVVYVLLLLHQANSLWTIRPIIIKLLSRDSWTSLVPGPQNHGTFKVSRSCPVLSRPGTFPGLPGTGQSCCHH